jgi:hypothetical protein
LVVQPHPAGIVREDHHFVGLAGDDHAVLAALVIRIRPLHQSPLRQSPLHQSPLTSSVSGVGVLHAATGKPLPATYVKVYVQYGEDRTMFHKDGYTDLRGRFDYASLGNGSVAGAKRIALFISNDAAGATVREVSPP